MSTSRSTLAKTVLLVACLALVVVGASRTDTTFAAWTDSLNVTGSSFTAYTVPAPTITGCVPTGTNASRTITFPLSGGVISPDTTYTGTVSPSMSAPTISTSGAGTATPSVSIVYVPNNNKNLSVTLTVTPSLTNAATWTGPTDFWKFTTPGSAAAPTCGEKTAPTIAISDPDGTTRTSAAMITYMNGAQGCGSNQRAACGTMSDASTISSVDYIIQRVQNGTTQCWSGTAYTSDCTTWRVGTIASQTTWQAKTASNINGTVYASPGGDFTIQVRATDSWGNTSDPTTTTFTVTP